MRAVGGAELRCVKAGRHQTVAAKARLLARTAEPLHDVQLDTGAVHVAVRTTKRPGLCSSTYREGVLARDSLSSGRPPVGYGDMSTTGVPLFEGMSATPWLIGNPRVLLPPAKRGLLCHRGRDQRRIRVAAPRCATSPRTGSSVNDGLAVSSAAPKGDEDVSSHQACEKLPRWLSTAFGVGLVASALLFPAAKVVRAEGKPASAGVAAAAVDRTSAGTPSANTSGGTERDGSGVAAKDTYTVKVTLSDGMRQWMDSENISLLFSTYTVGKVIAVGPGYGPDLALSERSFDGAMALMTTDSGGFHMSTRNHVWSFDSFLRPGRVYCKGRVFPAESEQAKGTDKKWDRVLIPRACHVAGGIDTHDLVEGKNKQLQAVITKFNCVADLDRSGNFSPVWAPKWISSLSFGDRCHLNGLCTNNSNKLAFATSVGTSDEVEGWRKERLEGGVVINIPQNKVICSGLSMPHSPRWHQNTLYVLEGGSGWFGFIDQKTGTFRRVCWCPGARHVWGTSATGICPWKLKLS
eukprot:scaffold87_cov388-Prasinococcus_capsulatus_cf.AAC.9